MIVLGVADSRDSGAAVCVDGKLIAAVGQSRLDRRIHSAAFPAAAIDAALRAAGVQANQVDRIVFGTAVTPPLYRRLLGTTARSRRRFVRGAFQAVLFRSGLYTLGADLARRLLEFKLDPRDFHAEIEMMSQPTAWANLAYRTQPARRCLALTLGMGGDGVTASAWLGNDGQLDPLWQQSSLAGLPVFLDHIAATLSLPTAARWEALGVRAAGVSAPRALLDRCRQTIFFDGDRFSRLWQAPDPADPFWVFVAGFSPEQRAAAAQALLEESALAFARRWIEETGCRVVAVAGELFENRRLLSRLVDSGMVDSLWMPQRPGEGGLAAGAALGSVEAAPFALDDDALGPPIAPGELDQALTRARVDRRASHQGDAMAMAQRCIAQGGRVGVFDGRLPWGWGGAGRMIVSAGGNIPKDSVPSGVTPQLLLDPKDAEQWVTIPAAGRTLCRHGGLWLPATARLKATCPSAVDASGCALITLAEDKGARGLSNWLGAMRFVPGVEALQIAPLQGASTPLAASPADAIDIWRQEHLDGLLLGERWIYSAYP